MNLIFCGSNSRNTVWGYIGIQKECPNEISGQITRDISISNSCTTGFYFQ